jgi:hypothetical protein
MTVEIDASGRWCCIVRRPMRSPLGSHRHFARDSSRDDRLDPRCDPGADRDSDKRGVSTPRTGSGTAPRQKQGGCSRPGSTADVGRMPSARGKERRACDANRDCASLHVHSHFAHRRVKRCFLEGAPSGANPRLVRGRQPPPIVAAPLAASAVPEQAVPVLASYSCFGTAWAGRITP